MPDRDPLHLEVSSSQKRTGTDKGAGREFLGEISAIDLVEFVIQAEVGTKDLDGDKVVHGHAGFFQGGFDSVEEEADFFFEIVRRLAGSLIDADAAGEIKSVANQNRITVRQRVLSVRQDNVPP